MRNTFPDRVTVSVFVASSRNSLGIVNPGELQHVGPGLMALYRSERVDDCERLFGSRLSQVSHCRALRTFSDWLSR